MTAGADGEWLLPGAPRPGAERTPVLEVTTRTVFPTVLVFSLYLLLVGHYGPGGGFSGGLVAGLAFVLRSLAGGSSEAWSAVRVRTTTVLGAGLLVVVVAALAPLAVGAPALSSAKVTVGPPLLGDVEFQTSLVLDVGVYLLVVGAVLDLLRTLGGGIDHDLGRPRDSPRSEEDA